MNYQAVSRILAMISVAFMLSAPFCWAQKAPPMTPVHEIITPDTPLNVKLLDAVRRLDVDAVRQLFDQGASADPWLSWPNHPDSTPFAMVTERNKRDRLTSSIVIFDLFIHRMSDLNASDSSGRTLLMVAADMNDLDAVKYLLQKGANVNAVTSGMGAGANVLSTRLLNENRPSPSVPPVVAYLLDHGVDVNAQDETGHTALMLTAQFGQIGIAKALLAHGADPNAQNKQGWNALQFASAIHRDDVVKLLYPLTKMDMCQAAEYGNADRVRELLASNTDPNKPNLRGWTPLMYAAATEDNTAILTQLLDHGALIGAASDRGMTALHAAALYGGSANVTYLLDHGADLNAPQHTTKSPPPLVLDTPLIDAVRESRADVVKIFLQRHVDLQKNRQGSNALELAIRTAGQSEPIRHGGPGHPKRRNPESLLDDQWTIIQLLVRAGVDIHTKDSHALFEATNAGQLGIVQFLLDAGADVNGSGDTPLIGAINAWSSPIADKEMHQEDQLTKEELSDIANEARAAKSIVQLLLQHKANVNLADATGKTPLMHGIEFGMADLAKILISHGARIDTRDQDGQTALMIATRNASATLSALLLDAKANPNLSDQNGFTALMLAIDPEADASQFGSSNPVRYSEWDVKEPPHAPSLGLLRLLLAHHADVNAVSKTHWTARKIALQDKFIPIVRLLKQAGAK